MNVRQEIQRHSADADKECLYWLFNRYSLESHWRFVAACSFVGYGVESYATHRVWAPTLAGRVLYRAEKLPQLVKAARAFLPDDSDNYTDADSGVVYRTCCNAPLDSWTFGKLPTNEYAPDCRAVAIQNALDALELPA